MPRVDYFDDAAAPPANSLVPSVTAVVVAPNLAFLDEEPEEALSERYRWLSVAAASLDAQQSS